MSVTSWIPEPEADRESVEVPIVEVTLLEDRAQVLRRGTFTVKKGRSRLVVEGVAPVLQDVSLRVEIESGEARVSDARARRALRLTRSDRPEAVRAIEDEIRALEQAFDDATDRRERAEERFEVVADILAKGAEEIPQDAAWGIVDDKGWADTFEGLFVRGRELQDEIIGHLHEQEDLARKIENAVHRRALAAARHHDTVARVELDVEATKGGEITLTVHYVVPNAMWRPIHSARLVDGEVTFQCSAAVWQATGEDWTDAQIVCSTARSSLGTEPPLLSDDLLTARKKDEEVVLAARQVAVQKAGVEAPSTAVELPGVDDGGDIQNLRVDGPTTVPSDGRPAILPLFHFTAPAELSRVSAPELADQVVLKSVQANTSPFPILAGPVELVQGSGVVGWTEVGFVAATERFELGFGPQDELRIQRLENIRETKVDPVDKWTRREVRLALYLSNLGDEARTVEVTERIPVAEVDEVKISILEGKHTTGSPKADENGFVTWSVELDPHARTLVRMSWELAVAPGVKGLL